MPKVSVVIPTYNRAYFLKEAIDSVLSQMYKDYEIIVVDDESTDTTRDVVKEYNGRVQYVFQRNGGIAAARNLGVRLSRGKYVAFLDDDDVWLPDRLSRQVPLLDADPDLAFVCAEVLVIDKEGNQTGHFRKDPDRKIKDKFEELFKGNYIQVPTVLLRKDCFNAAQGFDERFRTSQDYDLWLRIATKHKFFYIDEPLAKYRVHSGRISKNLDIKLGNNLAMFSKDEIVGGMIWSTRIIRKAQVYYQYAKLYYDSGNFPKAGTNFFKSVLVYPLIGSYYWPKEARNLKFSLPYRVAKVYYLAVKCIFLGLVRYKNA